MFVSNGTGKLQGENTYAANATFCSFAFASWVFFLRDSAVAPPLPSAISFFGAPAYLIAHSRATCSNSEGFRISMLATSASCGSLGSGVLRRDCKEMSADLMVSTGDHCVLSVSRQMAPFQLVSYKPKHVCGTMNSPSPSSRWGARAWSRSACSAVGTGSRSRS